jgi:hypothetical protein
MGVAVFLVGALSVSAEMIGLVALVVVFLVAVWLFSRVSQRGEFGLEVHRGWIWKLRVTEEGRADVPFFWPVPMVQQRLSAWWRSEVERVMATEVIEGATRGKRRSSKGK